MNKRIVSVIVSIVALIIVVGLWGNLVQNVDADEIVIIQYLNGELAFHNTAGIKMQWLGKVTPYPKMSHLTTDEIPVNTRFNDGGSAGMALSLQWEMPLDEENLRRLHTTYGSADAVTRQLVETVVRKSGYTSGPLMSSTESYAEKRNELFNYVEDQIRNGVYVTVRREIKTPDPISGKEKTLTIAERVPDSSSPGGFQRVEDSPIAVNGIRVSNIAITKINYSKIVEDQIATQQRNKMDVEIAVAEAKKAEQRALTAEEEGRAEATKAKWDQEVIKATMVTEAEQKRDVAALDKEAAEFTKQREILLGQGEAERKRLVLEADGALALKLATYEKVQNRWAAAFENYKGNIVPSVVMGGGEDGKMAGDGLQQFMYLLSAKAAKDLSLDLTTQQGRKAPQKVQK